MEIRIKQRVVVDALEDVKARDIVVFNTAHLPSMFERVVIASGESGRQLNALADRVREKVNEGGGRVYGVEGEKGGEWVLVDLGDVVVHIMHPQARAFYNLEEVWGGKTVKLKPAPEPVARKPAAKRKAAPKKKPARAKAPGRRRRR